jgi:hypothetical protein
MVKKHIIFIVLFAQTFCLFATSQIPDVLIYNGTEYNLHNFPMENWFNQFPEKRPPDNYNSGLWRRYVAIFEIKNNELWLIDVKKDVGVDMIYGRLIFESIMDKISEGEDAIKMDWFNGLLIFNHGNTRMDNISTYDYVLIDIKNGNVYEIINMTNEQYREFHNNRLREYIPIL